MKLPRPEPDELAEMIAARFRLLAEPTRVRLFDRLRAGEATVGELAGALGTSQQNVSKHVAMLADAGVLARRKVGNCVYYRIADENAIVLLDQVCGSLERRLVRLMKCVSRPGGPQAA
jgi:DNA-binding transcriptional ArsR family regulator